MTKQGFLDGFFIGYDEVADLSAPGYTPVQISLIASKVQEDLIVTKYSPKSNKMQDGFEETEKRVQDLGELVKYKTYTTFTTGFFDNSVEVILPNTLIANPTDFSDVYWFTIYEDSDSNILNCTIPNNTTIYTKPEVTEISHGQLKLALKDPYRKPYIKGSEGKVLRVRSEGRKHLLITDGTFNITKYKVGYIIKPEPIDLLLNLTDQVSKLSDHMHRELLQGTIEFCMKANQSVQQLGVEMSIPKE